LERRVKPQMHNITAGVEVCRDVTGRVSLAQEVRKRSIELGMLNDQLN
jgi:hypothetical protein